MTAKAMHATTQEISIEKNITPPRLKEGRCRRSQAMPAHKTSKMIAVLIRIST